MASRSLLEIFTDRPQRYRLLSKGWREWMDSIQTVRIGPILEVGCARGDSSAYLADGFGPVVFGLDINESGIEEAKQRHREMIVANKLHFIHGDAGALPFPDEHFTGVIMEASFSPLTDKMACLNELFRVLKPGGRVLLNDFAAKESIKDGETRRSKIPCFKGAESMEEYCKRFESAGFRAIHVKEEYGELIHLGLWLAKNLEVPGCDIENVLTASLSAGNGMDAANPENSTEKEIKLTYCQMVFEKE